MNAKGYSLLELCVAIVVLGLASVSFMDVMQLLSVSVQFDNRQAATVDVLDAVTETFAAHATTCSKNLEGTPFDPSVAAGFLVTQLDRYDLNGVQQGVILKSGEKLGTSGLTVRDMRVVPVATLDPKIVVAKLQINFESLAGSGPAQILLREIPLYTYLNAGRIFYCSPSPENEFTVNDKLCQLTSNGWAYYDIVNRQCNDDPRVTWTISPNKSLATCPPGRVLAGVASDPAAADVVCHATPSGVPVTPRVYTNGSQSTGFIYTHTKTADFVTNSCQFVYHALENTSLTTTQVKCVPAGAQPL